MNHRLIKFGAALLLAASLLALGGAAPAAAQPATYTVQAGDHLAEIARNNGTTTQALLDLNVDMYPSLATDPDFLRPGWVLKLN